MNRLIEKLKCWWNRSHYLGPLPYTMTSTNGDWWLECVKCGHIDNIKWEIKWVCGEETLATTWGLK